MPAKPGRPGGSKPERVSPDPRPIQGREIVALQVARRLVDTGVVADINIHAPGRESGEAMQLTKAFEARAGKDLATERSLRAAWDRQQGVNERS